MRKRTRRLAVAVSLLVVGGITAAAPSARANPSTYPNTGTITMAVQGAATPYPSEISVPTLSFDPNAVTVTLNGLTNGRARNVVVVLVAPNGQNVQLLGDVGGSNGVSGLNLTFQDGAAAVPDGESPFTSGTYRPSGNYSFSLPSPAPAYPHGTTLTPLVATGSATGTWKLFVYDSFPLVAETPGSISGGWSLTLSGSTETCLGAGLTQPVPSTSGLIVGTEGDDVILGTNGRDSIKGLGGFDIICGGGSSDTINGGPGPDNMQGGPGNDVMIGGGVPAGFVDGAFYPDATRGMNVNLINETAVGVGVDTLKAIDGVVGGPFNDVLNGDAQQNILRGKDGDDQLSGQAAGDILEGGSDNDLLSPGPGDDYLFGDCAVPLSGQLCEGGDDMASYVKAPLSHSSNGVGQGIHADLAKKTVKHFKWGTDALDSIEGVAGTRYEDELYGDSGANTLLGNGFDDIIRSYDGNDILGGGGGNDVLEAGPGSDVIDGGTNDSPGLREAGDVATWGGEPGPVNLDLAAASATDGQGGFDSIVNVERVSGSSGNDVLRGNGLANNLYGSTGQDELYGEAGQDYLDGGPDLDAAVGGPNRDVCAADVVDATCEIRTEEDQF